MASQHRYRNKSSVDLNLCDESIYLKFHDSVLDKLTEFIWANLKVSTSLSNTAAIYDRFVLCLIVSGLAGPHCLDEIRGLQYRDIASAGKGYILVPRFGGQYPIFIPKSVAALALSLCITLSRNGKEPKGRNRVGIFPMDGFILPDRQMPECKPTDEEWHHWKDSFGRWLHNIGEQVGSPISLNQLIQLARAHAAKFYPPPIAASLLGLQRSNPIPPESVQQIQALQGKFYSLPNQIPTPTKRKLSAPRFSGKLYTHLFGNEGVLQSNGPELELNLNDLSEPFDQLRRAVLIYARSSKAERNENRARAKFTLYRLIADWEHQLGKPQRKTWGDYFRQRDKKGWGFDQIPTVNAIFLGYFFIERMKSVKPPTVSNDLYTILLAANFALAQLLFRLDPNTIHEMVEERDLEPQSQAAEVEPLRQFFLFVSNSFSIPVNEINWFVFYKDPPIHEQALPSQTSIEEAVLYLLSGTKAEQTAGIGMLMAYFFTLREAELRGLTLGDVWFSGTPTVFIWRTKFDKNRSVEASDIPESVLKIMQEYDQRRRKVTHNDPAAYFLVDESGKKLPEQYFARYLNRAYKECYIEVQVGGKSSPIHILRHAGINRLVFLNYPLIDITNKAGHASPDTTNSSYIHLYPFLQQQFLAEHYQEKEIRITQPMLRCLTGLSDRRIRQIFIDNKISRINTIAQLVDFLSKFQSH